jgi:Trp operon repressor
LLIDSLVLDSIEIVEYSINYIYENKEYYLKELNENYYLSDNFYFMSVFSYLSNNKISWINKQKNINKKKFDLFVNFMTQVINEENKLNLFDCVLQSIEKDDIYLIQKLKVIISNENNPIIKEKMLNKFETVIKNSSNS